MKKAFKYISVTIFWVLLWYIISLLFDNTLLFPQPIQVLKRLFVLLKTKEYYISTLFSLLRVLSGIIIGVILGVLNGIICSKIKIFNDLHFPFITVIKTTPVVSFICLIMLFFKRDIVPVIISFLIVYPVVWANIFEGIKKIDSNLQEVCTFYKMTFPNKVKALYIPSLLPYFFSSLITSIGLGWKAGIASEVLCVPIKSIGRYIFESKLYIETEDLFAWTITVILLSVLLEKISVLCLKKLTKRR